MRLVAYILIAVMLVGCAGATYRPLIDPSRSPGNYETDLAECQKFAAGEAKTGESAAAGALFGAILGAALAAALGGDRQTRNYSAGLGAVEGGVVTGVAAERNTRDVIINCLRGRGYSVLR